MPLAAALLALLRCPETRQPLAPAPEPLLARARAEAWPTRAGAAPPPFEEALLRADGRLLYPIRQGIPILLLDDSILVLSV
jgi:uncharacterized protein YbaR (Trm112 family)